MLHGIIFFIAVQFNTVGVHVGVGVGRAGPVLREALPRHFLIVLIVFT